MDFNISVAMLAAGLEYAKFCLLENDAKHKLEIEQQKRLMEERHR